MKEQPIIFQGWGVRAILEDRKTQTRRTRGLDRINLETDVWTDPRYDASVGFWVFHGPHDYGMVRCPYGVPGDRLWVKETFCSPSLGIVGYAADSICGAWMHDGKGGNVWMHHGYILEAPGYREATRDPSKCIDTYSLKKYGGKWKPSIHMPRWASRLLLEITEVRVQRVQEISEEDARAEGAIPSTISQADIDSVQRGPSTDRDVAKLCRALGPGGFTAKFSFMEHWDSINAGLGFGWDVNPWCWCLSFKRVNPA